MATKFELSTFIKETIQTTGVDVRGSTPLDLLEKATFHHLSGSDPLFWLLPSDRWGMTIGTKVYVKHFAFWDITGSYQAQKKAAPKVWHELVHVAQCLDLGTIGFFADYLWEWILSGFDWRKIDLEEEAFEYEDRFRERM